MEGRRLGRYQITSKLAEGGMGAVYLAIHELMGREVVIKVLLPAMSTQREMVQRFFNEARATANLEHPGIVAIFDLDYADDGRAYIVMERLRGETLQERLRRTERLSVEQSVDVVKQVASAIGAAHAQGVVHRDLKPGNIFLIPDRETPGRERVKVLDFGVAKLALHQTSLITHQGMIFGTPPYMAPEQCVDAATVDHRADLYAVGCILYECLCSRPPFVGGAIEVLAAQLRDVPALPRTQNPRVPSWLEDLVMRLLDKTIDRRVQSCAELLDALDAGLRSWAGEPSPVTAAVQNTGRHTADAPHPQWPQAGGYRAGQNTAVGLHSDAESTSIPTMGSIASSAAELSTGQSGRGRRMWLGVSVATLGMLAVGMYLGLQKPDKDPTASHGPEHLPQQHTTGTDDAGWEADAGTAADIAAVLIAQAHAAIAQRDWAAAEAKGREVLQLSDDHTVQRRAQQTIDRAAAESASKLRYDSLRDAITKQDYPSVMAHFAAIDKGSVYHEEAQQAQDRARGAYVEQIVAEAEALSDQRKCLLIRRMQAEAHALWPEAGEQVGKIFDACHKALARRPRPQPPHELVEKDDRENLGNGSFDELLAEAQRAATNELYGKSRRLCSQALELQPGEPRAVMVCAIAACNLGNTRMAKRYYAMASESDQNQIFQICYSKNVQVREPGQAISPDGHP